jgi:hypothetical protein
MGFLKKAANEEDSSEETEQLEEQYMKLFPKIGRDFVHREDLEAILRQIMALLDPAGLAPIDITDDSEARGRAREYKVFLDDDKSGAEVYPDLIKLEDE